MLFQVNEQPGILYLLYARTRSATRCLCKYTFAYFLTLVREKLGIISVSNEYVLPKIFSYTTK